MADTLGDALPREIARVQELLPLYDAIPTGAFAATMMRNDLGRATKALAEGDTVGMLRVLEALKGYSA